MPICRKHEFQRGKYFMTTLWCGRYNFMHGKRKSIIIIIKAIEPLTAGVGLIIKVYQDNSAIGLGKHGKMT